MKHKLSKCISALLVMCMLLTIATPSVFAANGTASLSDTTMTESGSITVTFSGTATDTEYYNVQIADSSWSTTYVNTNITSGDDYTIAGYSAGTYQIYIGYWEDGSWKSDALSTTTFTVTEDDGGGSTDTYGLSLSISDGSPALGDSVTVTATINVGDDNQSDIPDGCALSIWYQHDNDWVTPVNGSSNTTSTTISLDSGNFTEGETYTVYAALYDSDWNTLASGNVTFTVSSGSSGGSSTYAVSITPSATTCEQNESITFTATVTYGEEAINLSNQSDVYLWIWADSWADGHSSGLTDCTISPNTGLANSVTISFPSAGTYYIACNLQDSSYTDILRNTDVATITVMESTADPSEEITTGTLSCDFMRGMDLSTFYTNWTNGAKYYDYDGNEYSQENNNAVDFFKFLYDECGVNWVRLRVWNDPYDEHGYPYGGGNNDVATAAIIGKWASEAGMTVLIDFHYSDFWADPGRQLAPKAWADMTIDEKVEALYDYTYESLETLLDAGVNVGMVQVGNETNGAFCGESIDWSTTFDADTNESWQNIVSLFKSGSSAVRDISAVYETNIKVALHFTNPNNANPSWYASLLEDAGVDYDAIGISYYMYWHGTLSNLQNQIETIANDYGKEVFIAETAYPYSSENYDDLGNQITSYDDFDMNANLYAISEAGQEAALTAILDTAANSYGCTGMFYWEPAWTTINSDSYRDAGGGWATKWASDYISYSMSSSEGSSFENQALFDNNGNALSGLRFYVDYVEGTENLPEHNYVLDENASTAATCTTDGENVYVCSGCGDSYSETVAATGHTTEVQNAKDATCTEDGCIGDEVCTLCGTTVTAGETIPATGHSYEAVVTAPTCTEGGYTTYTCTICGDTYTANETEAAGHSYEAVVTAPTCTKGGYTTYTCSVCGDTYTADETEATGHRYEAVVTAPTCTEGGYTTYTCSICGYTYTADETEAAGHTTEVQNTKAVSCTEDGYTGDTVCTVCGATVTAGEVIPATGHSYVASAVVDPTYTAQGYTIYTCTVCGDSYKADYTDILVLDETDESLKIQTNATSLDTVPESLTEMYASVDELKEYLISLITVTEGYDEANTAVYSVPLQYSEDGGITWIDVTADNFPTSGLTITIPYPDGTDSSYDFIVMSMYTVTSQRLGTTAGDTEFLNVEKTDAGLVVTLSAPSAMAISWNYTSAASEPTSTESTEDEPTTESTEDEPTSENTEDEPASENTEEETASENTEDETASESTEEETASENTEEETASENTEEETASENTEEETASESTEDETASENTGNSSSTNNISRSSPKTGDAAWMVSVLLMIACGGIITAESCRRRKQK